MVRTGNVDFSCKRLTSVEIRKSKYHIIRRVRFRWDPPPPEKDIWIRAWTDRQTVGWTDRVFLISCYYEFVKGEMFLEMEINLGEIKKMLAINIFSQFTRSS